MSEIREWSTTASGNDDTSPDGWPEGMDKAGVNNSARENMASVRKQAETFPWIQIVKLADTVSKGSDDQVVIANRDYTAIFTAGARIRIGDGVTFVERTIATSVFTTSTQLNLVVGELPIVQGTPTTVEYHVGKNGTAGYVDMGTGAGEALTLTDLGDGALLDMGVGNGFDADLLDGSHSEEIVLASALVVSRNMLVNPEFRRWREGISFTSAPDLTYVCDQWKALVKSDNHDFARSSIVPPGALYSILITHQTDSTQAGIYQFAEQQNCVVAVDDVVSLQFQVRGGGTRPDVIRYAIVEWTGAIDDLITTADDPITTWPASAGTDPTLEASLNIIASDEIILDGTWQSVALLNATVNASVKNIGVMIWVDDQDVSVGDSWNVSQVKLQVGPLGGVYEHPRAADHFLELDRYWLKTFTEEAVPAHNSEELIAPHFSVGERSWGYVTVAFSPTMLKAPTITYYNPEVSSPGSNFFRNLSDNTNWALDREYVTQDRVYAHPIFEAANDGDRFTVHIVADARFF